MGVDWGFMLLCLVNGSGHVGGEDRTCDELAKRDKEETDRARA